MEASQLAQSCRNSRRARPTSCALPLSSTARCSKEAESQAEYIESINKRFLQDAFGEAVEVYMVMLEDYVWRSILAKRGADFWGRWTSHQS